MQKVAEVESEGDVDGSAQLGQEARQLDAANAHPFGRVRTSDTLGVVKVLGEHVDQNQATGRGNVWNNEEIDAHQDLGTVKLRLEGKIFVPKIFLGVIVDGRISKFTKPVAGLVHFKNRWENCKYKGAE